MTTNYQCIEISSSISQVSIHSLSCHIFNYTGLPITIDIHPGSYIFDLFGASGGFSTFGKINEPGKGGITTGQANFKKETRLYLNIGGMGGNSSSGTPGSGGFNGGVSGGSDNGNHDCASGGSGGSTDIRTNINNIYSRIMVASGGGSPGCYITAGNGGNGGGISGDNGYQTSSGVLGGYGGGQIYGYSVGSGGIGESGESSSKGEAGGSGGGGYWGGNGGKTSCNACSGSGGGGGSSFISGYPGCISFREDGTQGTSSVHYSHISFLNGGMHTRSQYGHGYVIIRGINRQEYTCHFKHYSFPNILFVFVFLS